MTLFHTEEYPNNTRVRWVYDELYTPYGSFAYDTPEETRAAEEWEAERLADGRLVALGAIVERRAEGCDCAHCTGWHPVETEYVNGGGQRFTGPQDLWGIVIEPDTKALDEFARDTFVLD